MITSASGYEFVNVTNPSLAGFISGHILPKRDLDANGSSRDVKYEDYLFLLEALYERNNWGAVPSVTVTPARRSLMESALRGAVIGTSTAAGYIDRNATLPTVLVSTTQALSILQTLNAAVSLLPVTITRDLNPDNVRKMFLNLSLLKRSWKSLSWTDIATSWTDTRIYTHSDNTTTTNTPISYPDRLWSHGNATRVGSPYDSISITYNTSLGTFKHATAAWLLVKLVTVLYQQGSIATNTWYDIISLPCSVTNNGVVSVPSLSSLASAACYEHGINYTTGPSYISSGGGSVEITDYLLAVYNDFPAEIDSLNWNWQPT